jgi:hypothetical protein
VAAGLIVASFIFMKKVSDITQQRTELDPENETVG